MNTLPDLVSPPIEGVNVAMERIVFDPTRDQLITPRNGAGTTIRIPAGSIVDQRGVIVTKPVTLAYREFHDAAAIYASGIPMSMRVNGGQEHFESAGMFEIRAEDQKGESLFISREKGITVKMGSFFADSSFRFFHLDEELKNWAYQGEAAPEVNTERVEMTKNLLDKTPRHAIPFEEGYCVLNYHSLIDILAGDDYRVAEILQNSPKVKRKLAEFNLRHLDVSLYGMVRVNGRKYPVDAVVWKTLDGDPFKGYATDCQTHYMGNKVYRFVVKYNDGRKWIGDMEAVMPIQKLFARDAAYWKDTYNEAMAEVKELEKRIKEKEVVYRTFEIAGFGIYNWDKFMKKENSKPMLVHTRMQFDKPLSKTEDLRANHFFLIGPDRNSLVRLNPDVYFKDSLFIQPLPGSMIITNLEGGRLALLKAEEYDKIPFSTLRKGQTVSMNFTVSDFKVESVEDIRTMLGS